MVTIKTENEATMINWVIKSENTITNLLLATIIVRNTGWPLSCFSGLNILKRARKFENAETWLSNFQEYIMLKLIQQNRYFSIFGRFWSYQLQGKTSWTPCIQLYKLKPWWVVKSSQYCPSITSVTPWWWCGLDKLIIALLYSPESNVCLSAIARA